MNNIETGFGGMIIGELYLYEDINEAVYKGGEVSIIVYGDEGEGYPHFHVKKTNGEGFSKTDGKSGDCCILLTKAQFWPHDGHLATLGRKQMKQIDEWMRLPNKSEPYKTNWEVACDLWKTQINDKGFNGVTEQPDYSRMGK